MSAREPLRQDPGSAPARVMEVALRLFSEQGYFNTSIPDIVRASGVSTGSIYHHFGDKEGIARALFDALVGRMEQELRRIEQAHPDTRSRCRAVVELLFRITEEEPATMEFMLFARHREFMPAVAPVCSSRPFRHMREMIVAGIDAGEIRPMDPMVAAALVFGSALRLVSLRLDGLLEDPPAAHLEELWTGAWRAVAP